MDKLDPKALEAAYTKMFTNENRTGAVGQDELRVPSRADQTPYEDFVRDYLDAADLVPRSTLQEMIVERDVLLNELTEARQGHDKIEAERDEARREAEELKARCKELDTECDNLVFREKEALSLAETRGKQIAALREAGQDLLDRLKHYHEKHLPEWGTHEDQECEGRLFETLTDTAEAAAQYQRVPEDCAVMPLALLRQARRVLSCPARSTRLTRELIHLGDAITAAEGCFAAPKAGEPEEEG